MRFFDQHWVARTVTQKETIALNAFTDEVVVPWNANDVCTSVEEAANGIIFNTAVEKDDRFWFSLGLGCLVGDGLFDADLRDEVVFVWVVELAARDFSCIFSSEYFSKHGAVGTEVLGNRAGVEAGDGWNVIGL